MEYMLSYMNHLCSGCCASFVNTIMLLLSTVMAVLPISLLLDTSVESCLGEGQGYRE